MDEQTTTELLDGSMDFDTPDHMGRTLKRLWHSVNDQHKRLVVVLVSVIFYTFLSIIAPLYLSLIHIWIVYKLA